MLTLDGNSWYLPTLATMLTLDYYYYYGIIITGIYRAMLTLDGSAHGHHLIRVHTAVGLLLEDLAHDLVHLQEHQTH